MFPPFREVGAQLPAQEYYVGRPQKEESKDPYGQRKDETLARIFQGGDEGTTQRGEASTGQPLRVACA